MKLAIIGAASPRFPLLLHSLIQRPDIELDELCLYDLDSEKLTILYNTVIAAITEHHAPTFTIHMASSLVEAVRGAHYIFSSIRVGGQQARMIDEQVPLAFDLIGQETLGAGGLFLALRTIPVVLEQVEIIKEHAPDAWIINFTNPSGLVTQAVKSLAGYERIIGICDAPELIATHAATIYHCRPEDVELRYFGLNHYGWVYSLMVTGEEKLSDLIAHHLDEFIALEPFYEGMRDHMRTTNLIANEYLYYYLNTSSVVANQKAAPAGRAEQIRGLDDALYVALREAQRPPLEPYNDYIDRRNASYMQMESGYARTNDTTFSLLDSHNPNGYDAIALNVLSALQHGTGPSLILNVLNDGAFPPLKTTDVIEASTRFTSDGPRVITPPPALSHEILDRIGVMKRYERQVVDAVRLHSEDEAIKALRIHPLVGPDAAASVFKALKSAHEQNGSPPIFG